jgi:hypothetical protein
VPVRAKESAAWTRELDVILLDGIEDNRQGKDLAHSASEGFAPSAAVKAPLPQGFSSCSARAWGWSARCSTRKPSTVAARKGGVGKSLPSSVLAQYFMARAEQDTDKRALQGIRTRRDPPKIIAHHPILLKRRLCPQHPHDCNHGGNAGSRIRGRPS